MTSSPATTSQTLARPELSRAKASELERRLQAVRRPQPVLSRDAEADLTNRQREILDQLGEIFHHGFSSLTMADLASRLGCSLRTLYSLAPSRDELVMVVVDRNLWKTGRQAMAAIEPHMAPMEALRAYLGAANLAVENTTQAFATDTVNMAEWSDLGLAHTNYLIAVTSSVLGMAQEIGEIGNVDIAAVAHVIAGLGRTFANPDMISAIRSTPTEAANEVLDLFLVGLAAGV